jgi:hypothetical protein
MALLEALSPHYVQETISGEFRHEDGPALPASKGTTSGDPADVEASLPARVRNKCPS